MTSHMLSKLILAGLALAALSCVGPARVREQPGGEGYSSEATIHGSNDEARLARAKQLVRDGRYAEAVREFRSVYEKGGAKSADRQEALFQLGVVYSDLLNPHRNPETAIAHFKNLLREFPGTSYGKDAQERIANLERLLQETGG